MKTQRQIWKNINEPKIKKLIPIFDENGKPSSVIEVLDRIPIFLRERKQQK